MTSQGFGGCRFFVVFLFWCRFFVLKKNHVHCCAAFRRSYWELVRGFDEQMPQWDDYDLWIRLAAGGARIHRLAGDHFYYRKHGPSLSLHSPSSARPRGTIWIINTVY